MGTIEITQRRQRTRTSTIFVSWGRGPRELIKAGAVVKFKVPARRTSRGYAQCMEEAHWGRGVDVQIIHGQR